MFCLKLCIWLWPLCDYQTWKDYSIEGKTEAVTGVENGAYLNQSISQRISVYFYTQPFTHKGGCPNEGKFSGNTESLKVSWEIKNSSSSLFSGTSNWEITLLRNKSTVPLTLAYHIRTFLLLGVYRQYKTATIYHSLFSTLVSFSNILGPSLLLLSDDYFTFYKYWSCFL